MSARQVVYTCPDGTDFSVEWQDPADEQYGWFWDQMHCPLPLTPLSADLWSDITTGFVRSFDVTGMPGHAAFRQVHGYNFSRQSPFDGDPAVRAAMLQRDLARRGARLLELWRSDYEPEARALNRAIRSLAAGLDALSLEDAFAQARAARRRLGELHMLAMGSTGQAASSFIALCKQEFGPEGELVATDLMGGFYSKAIESAIGLWDLAQAANASEPVATLIRGEAPRAVLAKLDGVRGGPEFVRLLREYLEVYGLRNESFSELSFPTWREDLRFPLLMIRRYIDARPDSSPQALHRRVEERREQRLEEVSAKLSGDPEKWANFQRPMRIAQQRTVLLEDHNFYIDQQAPAMTRELALAAAGRLQASGVIDKPDDIFYLTVQELLSTESGAATDFRPKVAERRAERDRWMRVLPPASIGAGAVMMPEALQQFFGPLANEPMEAGSFRGIAGSPGVIRGTARLILGLDDIDRLAPGEILVTYATAPPWTPVFAIAGGIVTDAGGTLSHCAVVAREYGIPAVVGTRVATATIQDGMLITVDGTAGVVRIES